MRDGDIYCMNDPYLGGTHLPDIAVVMPVFARGRPIAFAAAMTHHQDVGGMAPGSVPTNATEIFQEGIRLPPLKLRDGDVFNDTLLKILRRNVRIPETFEGDLMAQVAACTVGGAAAAALANTYGDNHLTAIFAELLDRSEAMTRDALRAIPQGTYRAVDFLDNDGIELDRRIRIEVAVTVGDGAMTVDFAGSSPQVRGPFNVVPSGSLAASCFALRAITDPSITTNGGCFRPITLKLPERLDRQSERAGAGQLPHRDHQAHHRHDPGAFAEAVPGPRAGRQCGRAAGAAVRRRAARRRRATSPANWSRAARRQPRQGWRRRHRDRRHQLHEPARRSARARCADPRQPHHAAARFRRRRRASRRPRHLARIRDPATAKCALRIAASGISSRPKGSAGGRDGADGAHRHLPQAMAARR